MNSRERFLRACRSEKVDRPPVWLMRQAGRYLPEYQEIRKQLSLLEMFTKAEVITEVSLQPWRRFGMDAVIVFSDILIPPMAMGMNVVYEGLRVAGPAASTFCRPPNMEASVKRSLASPATHETPPYFTNPIRETEDVKKLKNFDPLSKCPFLYDGLRELRKTLGDETALIGFCGTPWTTAYYMLEKKIEIWKKDRPTILKKLLSTVTQNLKSYLLAQVESCVDVIQLFDSWGGLLSKKEYEEWSGNFVAEIVEALQKKKKPLILFVKESDRLLKAMKKTGADVLSVGPTTDLKDVFTAVQGNLDSEILLHQSADVVKEETEKMLRSMKNRSGYIANLGHGVLPKTPVENVEMFVETVRSYDRTIVR